MSGWARPPPQRDLDLKGSRVALQNWGVTWTRTSERTWGPASPLTALVTTDMEQICRDRCSEEATSRSTSDRKRVKKVWKQSETVAERSCDVGFDV